MFFLLPFALAKPVDPFSEPDGAEQFRAERQVVTVSTLFAQTIEQAPSIVTLITSEDIRRSGYRTLSDVLATIPGIYISTANESRKLGWFRGVISSDNNKILLLIDGVPWYDGVYTHAWLDEYIPLFHVKQIEVIKGPGSAIYGTNAFAGVINVVTYAESDARHNIVRFSVGSFARRELGVFTTEKFSDNKRVSVYARYLELDGDGLDVTPKGFRNVTATNPRRSINGGARFDWDWLQIRYDFVDFRHIYFVNPQYDIWSVFAESADEFNLRYQNDFLRAQLHIPIGKTASVKPYAYFHRYDNHSNYGWVQEPEITVDTSSSSDIRIGQNSDSYSAIIPRTLVEANKLTYRYGAGVDSTWRPSFSHMTATGVGVVDTQVIELQDNVFSNGGSEASYIDGFYAPPNSRITNLFGFAQHTWTTSWWLELTAGMRMDVYNSLFVGDLADRSGSKFFFSPRVGALLVPASDTFVKLLWGRAFRAPNARELFIYQVPDANLEVEYFNGNPDLQPESIDTFEAEVSAKLAAGWSCRSSVFYSIVQDEINKHLSDPAHPVLGNAYYRNIGSSSAFGGEAEVQWKRLEYLVDVRYSYTLATDLSSGFQQYAFPPHMGHFRFGWNPDGKVWLNLRAHLFGERPREEWTPNSQLSNGEPFGLVHFTLSSGDTKEGRLRWDASILNLFDTQYNTMIYVDDADEVLADGSPKYPNDYSAERRSFYIGVEGNY